MKKTNTHDLVLAALCAALTAVVAPFSIAIGPISLTLSVFAVLFTGAMLRPGWAFAAQVVYIAIGAIGLPVFSGFKSGPQVLLGATGGYLVAYPLMALVLSLVCQHFKGFLPRLVGVILAVALCYTFGTAWFMFMSGNDLATSLAWCVTPFVIPDLIKGVCALLLAKALESRLNKAAV